MMIKIQKAKPDEAVTVEMTLAGETFEIDLMPITDEERINAFKAFRKRKQLYNPLSKGMELVSYFDDEDPAFRKAADDLLDKIIVDFRGVGDAEGNPIDGKLLENKLLLGSISVEDVEEIPVVDESGATSIIRQARKRLLRALIVDRAVALSQATAEVDEKN